MSHIMFVSVKALKHRGRKPSEGFTGRESRGFIKSYDERKDRERSTSEYH